MPACDRPAYVHPNPHEADRRLRVAVQVLDADCLRILALPTNEKEFAFPGLIDLLMGYGNAVLTPNWREHQMIMSAVLGGMQDSIFHTQCIPTLPEISCPHDVVDAIEGGTVWRVAGALRGPYVLLKGLNDVLAAYIPHWATEGEACVWISAVGSFCGAPGSPKRSAGQGDVLCGVLAALLAMSRPPEEGVREPGRIFGAMHAACVLTRRSAALAFDKKKRSVGAQDLLDALGEAGEKVFPETWSKVEKSE